MKAMLVLATVADLALAALLIGVSGFVFGGGPEGMRGEFWAATGWIAAFVICLAAPVIGFLLMRRAQPALGVLVGWLPPIAGVAITFAPINPY